jgi:hypothetical protein
LAHACRNARMRFLKTRPMVRAVVTTRRSQFAAPAGLPLLGHINTVGTSTLAVSERLSFGNVHALDFRFHNASEQTRRKQVVKAEQIHVCAYHSLCVGKLAGGQAACCSVGLPGSSRVRAAAPGHRSGQAPNAKLIWLNGHFQRAVRYFGAINFTFPINSFCSTSLGSGVELVRFATVAPRAARNSS